MLAVVQKEKRKKKKEKKEEEKKKSDSVLREERETVTVHCTMYTLLYVCNALRLRFLESRRKRPIVNQTNAGTASDPRQRWMRQLQRGEGKLIITGFPRAGL